MKTYWEHIGVDIAKWVWDTWQFNCNLEKKKKTFQDMSLWREWCYISNQSVFLIFESNQGLDCMNASTFLAI